VRKFYQLLSVDLQQFLIKPEAFYIEDKSVGWASLFALLFV